MRCVSDLEIRILTVSGTIYLFLARFIRYSHGGTGR